MLVHTDKRFLYAGTYQSWESSTACPDHILLLLTIRDIQQHADALTSLSPHLQAANVQAMVGGGQEVQSLIARVEDGYALVDDLDQNLDILDLKLRHMRADIAAIEDRNNALQVRCGVM